MLIRLDGNLIINAEDISSVIKMGENEYHIRYKEGFFFSH